MNKGSRSLFVYKLARFGAFSIGAVYILVGVIAILSLLRIKKGGADEDSILKFLAGIPLGEGLIAIILLGMLGYITWRVYDAIADPYKYGSSFKGLAIRSGIALSALAYGTIAYTAIQTLLGQTINTHGRPVQQRQMVANVFQWEGGEWLVGLLGAIVAFTGLVDFIYAIKLSYREKMNWQGLSHIKKTVITILAWIGNFARGIILLIIAYFFIKASIKSDPQEVVNTDKAFNFLGEQIGHGMFTAVAVGTICYGLYMFLLGFFHDFDKDMKG